METNTPADDLGEALRLLQLAEAEEREAERVQELEALGREPDD